MINKIIDIFKKLDKLTYKIMKNGLFFCLTFATISALILFTYMTSSFSISTYYVGITLFKLSCIFSVEFIICGIIVDSIKKQLV